MKLSLLERLEKSQPISTALNNCRPYCTKLRCNIAEPMIDMGLRMCSKGICVSTPYPPTCLL